MRKYIAVSGFGWSGSGAVVDLLREFKQVKAVDFEFRLIKDPYGILDLHKALCQNQDLLKMDVAISDFKRLCKVLARNNNYFFGVGYNYSTSINKDFLKIADEYIYSLQDYSYMNRSMVFNYHKSKYRYFIDKILVKLSLKLPGELSGIYRNSNEDFEQKTRKFLSALFEGYSSPNEIILLDQMIPVNDVKKSLEYFDDIKLIIVDRDPRDIYVDLVNKKSLIGADLIESNNVDKFISWFLVSRESKEKAPNVMRINFEELVMNYESSVSILHDFIGKDLEHHFKGDYFVEELSKKNIGQWKSYPHQDVMQDIRDKLKDFCLD